MHVIVDAYISHCVGVYVYVGVWDVMSNVEVVEFIRKKIASNMKPPLVSNVPLF